MSVPVGIPCQVSVDIDDCALGKPPSGLLYRWIPLPVHSNACMLCIHLCYTSNTKWLELASLE